MSDTRLLHPTVQHPARGVSRRASRRVTSSVAHLMQMYCRAWADAAAICSCRYNALQVEGAVFIQGLWDFVLKYIEETEDSVAAANECAELPSALCRAVCHDKLEGLCAGMTA